jgi:hypothetical protein
MACRRCDGHGLVEIDVADGASAGFTYRCGCPAGDRYDKKFPLAPPELRVVPDPVNRLTKADRRAWLADLKDSITRHPANRKDRP